jgi:hypothetical protein
VTGGGTQAVAQGARAHATQWFDDYKNKMACRHQPFNLASVISNGCKVQLTHPINILFQ